MKRSATDTSALSKIRPSVKSGNVLPSSSTDVSFKETPIYHGTDAEVLDRGVGHLLGSSLPVGGENTHTILSGHSGMASQKMFTDLEQLTPGDVFYLNVLNETLACITELSTGDEVVITNLWERLRYRVVGTKIIEPHEIENILIQPGRDMVTLLTCHPYASGGKQRYLVYCQRIPEYDIMEVPYD